MAALVEKAGLAVAFAFVRHRPFARGLRMVIVFDTACVLVYATWPVTSCSLAAGRSVAGMRSRTHPPPHGPR